MSNLATGKLGEEIAKDYLLKNGYKILERNFHSRWGELDLIAVKDNSLLFIEVKTRIGDRYGKPHDSITLFKLSHLKRPIQYFLLKNSFKKYKLSLDVISIVLKEDLTVKILRHFKNVTTYK